MFRVGLGQDSHWFDEENKPLILGGVEVAKTGGLKANSDGDAILHSLCNAVSSALGGDSLGTWADEMFAKQGVTDSQEFVKKIMEKVKERGWKVVNVAVAIEAGKPRIPLEMFQKMKKEIGKLLGIASSGVGITITSGERITPFGRGEAIQVFSSVLLYKN